MKPFFTVQPMTTLTTKKRKDVCGHSPQCDTFLLTNTSDETVRICQRDAVSYGWGILHEFAMIPEIKVSRGWTEDEINRLDHYIQTHDITYGTYQQLADVFRKTPKQIKDKVYYLRHKAKNRGVTV